MPTQFVELPAIGSPQRQQMIQQMANAFGTPRDGQFGAVNPDAIYNQLSQLNYHDRITLLRDVFRFQGITVIEEISDPERAVRIALLNRLGRGADQVPTFAGVNRFFHLMSDAPQDAHHEALLAGEMNLVFREMPENQFSDRTTPGVQEVLQQFLRPATNPYQRLRAIGINPGAAPVRRPPLPVLAAPAYQALPAANTEARAALVAQLVAAAGQPRTMTEGFRGFQNPEAFFRLMANYSYENRIALYREVLTAQGWGDVARMPEHNVRLNMLNRFMYNWDGQTTFAGVDRYFRMMSDAPRDTNHRVMLNNEMRYLITDVNYSAFVDRAEPGIEGNYQRFFCIGGRHPALLTADPYSRMSLIGISVGRQPVLPAAMAPAAALPPFGTLGDFPGGGRPNGLLEFSNEPSLHLCSVGPDNPHRTYVGVGGVTPLAIV